MSILYLQFIIPSPLLNCSISSIKGDFESCQHQTRSMLCTAILNKISASKHIETPLIGQRFNTHADHELDLQLRFTQCRSLYASSSDETPDGDENKSFMIRTTATTYQATM